MKIIVKTFVIILLASLIVACSSQPKHEFIDIHGQTIKLKQHPGKWLVVNYWASWCKPCWKEMPELNKFYKMYQADKALVIGVSYDHVSLEKLKKITQKMQIQFPVLASDPAQLLGIKKVPGLPATFIFNPKGQLVDTLLGPQTEQKLAEVIGAPKIAQYS